eukprot:8480105-Alexandrium_andersonii.AAC.1
MTSARLDAFASDKNAKLFFDKSQALTPRLHVSRRPKLNRLANCDARLHETLHGVEPEHGRSAMFNIRLPPTVAT